jgi:GGDEF domain-containing protein
MNYLLAPDLVAMGLLLSILYFLRRRHPHKTVDFWLIGLARLGGDEFIILATDLPAGQTVGAVAEAGAARISRALRKPVSINGHLFNVTGSIGVAVYPDDATDEVLLRRLADQRLYEQKRQIPLTF